MIKKFVILFIIASCFLLIASPVFAKDFSSFYKVTYEFGKNGETAITQEISLVNQVSNLYVSQYSLSLMSGQISNVEAYDKIGPLKTKVEQKGETTIITLDFNDKVVGKDKILSFILKYRASGLAKKEGNLWQISIPKLVNAEDIDEFQVLIKVPLEYGKMSVINPTPFENKIENGFYNLSFKKENIVSYGVMATFGQYQTFNFKILYELKNSENSPKIEKIALPPDTNYQTLFYDSIKPEPFDVKADEDDNWFAFYQLPPRENLLIEVTGQVNLFSQPKKPKISPVSHQDYLSATRYWEANSQKIIDLANKLKTPENIYKFVSTNLTYNYQRVKEGTTIRTGALGALASPRQSTCTQFTDLFIAICRAAGIPAREIVGYSYTDNPQLRQISQDIDLLHSWPEYFDANKNQWTAVDPTWGNTTGGLDYFNKFDMSHFAFVIHGKSDILPPPPGSSMEDELKKKIFVTFGEESLKNVPPLFNIEEISPPVIYSLKNNRVGILFKNNSGKALYSEKVVSLSSDLEPGQWYFERILPFSQFKIEFFVKPKERFKDYTWQLVFTLGENKIKYNIKVKSLLLRLTVLLGSGLSLTIIILILSIRKTSCKAKEKGAIVQKDNIFR